MDRRGRKQSRLPPHLATRTVNTFQQLCCYAETRAVLCVVTACGLEALLLSGAGGRLSWAELSHSFFTRTYSLMAAWAS